MSDQSGDFIANLLSNLSKNGFPERKVALPLDKLYESAHNKGVNFNKILAFLLEQKDIDHEKTSTKIIFSPKADVSKDPDPSDVMPGIENMSDIIKLGQQMFGDNITPENMSAEDLNFSELAKKARGMIANMTPEQIANLQKMAGGLSEDQKKDLMKKAKDLGIE